ncbi:MAG: SDR family NAD(P)-dependent oxidoreductase [Cyanobacteria bacterium J06555_3]
MSKYLEQVFSLEGQYAIVTCAATELGGAVVRGLAQSGAIVCGTDIHQFSESKLSQGGFYIRCNLDHAPQFQLLCEEVYRQYSQLDILINVGEISASTQDLPRNLVNNFRQTVERQLKTAVRTSRTAANYLKQSGGGSIINIISIKNAVGFPTDFSYIATKNALLMMTKELSLELIKDNIRVNNIVLGSSQAAPDPERNDWQDLVKTVVYLATAGSDSMTGQDVFLVGDRVSTSPG